MIQTLKEKVASICCQGIVGDRFEENTQSSLETEHEEIFLILLVRELNNLHDFSLKLLKQRLPMQP